MRVQIIPALAITAAIVVTVAAYGVARRPAQPFQGTDITGAQWGRGLDLADHNGRRRTLADFRGKVVLVFFGFTNCPDACPTALAEMARVVNQVGADRVQGLFVTVDPKRDSAARLAAYLSGFHPSFLGLRGSKGELEKVTKEFRVYHHAQTGDVGSDSSHGGAHGTSYVVDHSTGIYAFDKEGRARLYFSANGRSVETMVHDVLLLVSQ